MAQYSDYVQILLELREELQKLTALQPNKIAAVRAHDLDALNECMKQEQAASLALRGLEQRRSKVAAELGLADVALRQVAQHCPEGVRGAMGEAVEHLLRESEQLRSAQDAARTVVEKDLRRVNEELERRGVSSEMDEGYQTAPGIPPKGMRTDFRA